MSPVSKTLAALAALLIAAAAHASAERVDQLVSQIEASPAGCSAVPASQQAQRMTVETDVARFSSLVDVPAQVHFQVLDCEADGFVYQGSTIVLSSHLARMNAQQRFFIIAHEFGHVSLGHHGEIRSFVARVVDRHPDASRSEVAEGVRTLSKQHELDADAFAVRTMLQVGYDPEQAARIFDAIHDGGDTDTHPSAQRRALAIRSLAHEPTRLSMGN